MIVGFKFEIVLFKCDKYGCSVECSVKLFDQLEFQFGELIVDVVEDWVQVEWKMIKVGVFEWCKLVKKVFLDYLLCECVVVEVFSICLCCGFDCIVKMGEDIIEMLEVVLCQWKVIQMVWEKFMCWVCEKIIQFLVFFYLILWGWVGFSLLVMIVFEKYGQYQFFNCQVECYVCEGVDFSFFMFVDQVGVVVELLKLLNVLFEVYVFIVVWLYGDDMIVLLLVCGGMKIVWFWIYVCDDCFFDGIVLFVVVFCFFFDCVGEYLMKYLVGWQGILQVDVYVGYNQFYDVV